jgi:hypothetical protein
MALVVFVAHPFIARLPDAGVRPALAGGPSRNQPPSRALLRVRT